MAFKIYVHTYLYIYIYREREKYIYIYIYMYPAPDLSLKIKPQESLHESHDELMSRRMRPAVKSHLPACKEGWLRTLNTNGAAANIIDFDRLGKKVRPGTFGEIKSRLTGAPKRSPCQKTHKIRSDPMSADPIRPFPRNR